jgi:hypothetical protein
MDILAGMFAYVAGIGALVAGLTVSFFVFFAVPQEPIQTQAGPQTASAMLVRPSTANKPVTVDPHAKQSASHSEEHAAVAALPSVARPTAYARDFRHKHTKSAAQARQRVQEERARRWAYQQNSSFNSHFLGYAD